MKFKNLRKFKSNTLSYLRLWSDTPMTSKPFSYMQHDSKELIIVWITDILPKFILISSKTPGFDFIPLQILFNPSLPI